MLIASISIYPLISLKLIGVTVRDFLYYDFISQCSVCRYARVGNSKGSYYFVVVFFVFILQVDENLEQWPHLNELVQCYRTDWVKDENKYGHYESISPVSFQNQIFEGPDTDLETGKVGKFFSDFT
jgi:hypothetical protein